MDLGPIREVNYGHRKDNAVVVKYDGVTAYVKDTHVDYNFLAGGSKAGLPLAEARAKVWAALHDGKFSKKVSGGSPQFFVRIDR